MANKTIKTRIINKHDTEANWKKAVNFIPKKGEIVIYDDLKKIKIGDGTTVVSSLPFVEQDLSNIPGYVDCKQINCTAIALLDECATNNEAVGSIAEDEVLCNALNILGDPNIGEASKSLVFSGWYYDDGGGTGYSTSAFVTFTYVGSEGQTGQTAFFGNYFCVHETWSCFKFFATFDPSSKELTVMNTTTVEYLIYKETLKELLSVNEKVDKIIGKGLSTNDYTNTEKNKLAGIETGAQKNRNSITSVQGKTSGAITISKSDVGLSAVVNTGDSATPTSGGTTKFTTGGAYTMQQSLQSAINSKQATLTSTQLNAVNSGITSTKVSTYDGYASQIAGKQNTLTAGTNISISGNTINCTYSYTGVKAKDNGDGTITFTWSE